MSFRRWWMFWRVGVGIPGVTPRDIFAHDVIGTTRRNGKAAASTAIG